MLKEGHAGALPRHNITSPTSRHTASHIIFTSYKRTGWQGRFSRHYHHYYIYHTIIIIPHIYHIYYHCQSAPHTYILFVYRTITRSPQRCNERSPRSPTVDWQRNGVCVRARIQQQQQQHITSPTGELYIWRAARAQARARERYRHIQQAPHIIITSS